MEMKIVCNERRLCTCCMEEHEVKTVQITENTSFKNIDVNYEATYFYCELADELYMDEAQMRSNDIAIKDAYRKIQGLLTSREIIDIRAKYGITQSDLSILLGWGGKTITRYESYQIQDKAHDSILKKLSHDPAWFLELLNDAKENLAKESYIKYFNIATHLYESDRDLYLRKSIEAQYAKYYENPMFSGNAPLALDKVVDVIRYFASSVKVNCLYKVKLMKMLWYTDALSYKTNGKAITGLIYRALPMGAVPIGHDSIIDLQGVPCEEIDMGETYAYHFALAESCEYSSLTMEDKRILDIVINKFGRMSTKEIVDYMHKEAAYRETVPKDIIQFKYAESLQI